jgi:membrane protease subunit HflC
LALISCFRAEGEEQAAILRAQADRERTVILAEGYAEAQALRGEGEALAIKIYAAALEQDPEFYAFTRRLDAYEITLKDGDTIVIPVDSDFFRYLTSSAVVPADGAEETAGEAGE